MYQFTVCAEFPAPMPIAFAAATSNLDALLEDIPQLVELRTLQRDHLCPECERIALRMRAALQLPGLAGTVLQPDWLRWREELLCHHSPPSIEWQVHTDVFSEQVHCNGETVFQPSPTGTYACSYGRFSLELDSIPGIPDSWALRCNALLEKLLGQMIAPNVEAYFAAVKRRLETGSGAEAPPLRQH